MAPWTRGPGYDLRGVMSDSVARGPVDPWTLLSSCGAGSDCVAGGPVDPGPVDEQLFRVFLRGVTWDRPLILGKFPKQPAAESVLYIVSLLASVSSFPTW